MSPAIAPIAQRLLAHAPTEHPPEDGLRWAAVAIILRDSPAGPDVLLIERARHDKDPWSGHMAFPGGRLDPEDPALITTAVRETQEEVGLDLSARGQVLGQLDDLHAVGRGIRLPLVIRPYVFYLREPGPLTPNDEVESTVWIPVSFLSDPANVGSFDYPFQGQAMAFPCYDFDRYRVWGLTFRMIQSLFEALGAPVHDGW